MGAFLVRELLPSSLRDATSLKEGGFWQYGEVFLLAKGSLPEGAGKPAGFD